MLPRYLIGQPAAAADARDGSTIFLLDTTEQPPLFLRVDPEVNLADALGVLDGDTGGDSLCVRYWAAGPLHCDGNHLLSRLSRALTIYRDEVEAVRDPDLPPQRLTLGHLPHLEPLLAGVPRGEAGLPAIVADGAHAELPFKWSGVILPGHDCLHLWRHDETQDHLEFDRAIPAGRPVTDEDYGAGALAARLAWEELHANLPPEPGARS